MANIGLIYLFTVLSFSSSASIRGVRCSALKCVIQGCMDTAFQIESHLLYLPYSAQ